MKPYACIAPGQNAQYVGMGSDLYNSNNPTIRDITRARFKEASEIVGHDLSKLCFEGPKGELDQTINTQPALLTHSTVCYEVFKELHRQELRQEFDFTVAAGASLGEYFALMIAGVMDFQSTLGLVHERAKAMDQIIKDDQLPTGKQLCLMYSRKVDAKTLDELCAKFGIEPSNCNYDGQTVVGGYEENIDELRADMGNIPSIKVIEMNTEAAFHTSLMAAAKLLFAPAVESATLANPQKLVISNCTGNFYEMDGSDLRMNMKYQINSPVRWHQGMKRMITKLKEARKGEEKMAIFEFGGGKPNINDPSEQKANFEGITRGNLKANGLSANDINLYACISEMTILETIKRLSE